MIFFRNNILSVFDGYYGNPVASTFKSLRNPSIPKLLEREIQPPLEVSSITKILREHGHNTNHGQVFLLVTQDPKSYGVSRVHFSVPHPDVDDMFTIFETTRGHFTGEKKFPVFSGINERRSRRNWHWATDHGGCRLLRRSKEKTDSAHPSS